MMKNVWRRQKAIRDYNHMINSGWRTGHARGYAEGHAEGLAEGHAEGHLAVNTRDWTHTSKISAMLGTQTKNREISNSRLFSNISP